MNNPSKTTEPAHLRAGASRSAWDPAAGAPGSAAGLAAGAWLTPLTGHWTAAACAHLALHPTVVRVTVLALRGSAPREPGASMLVDAHGAVGTIGGGHLEWLATTTARQLLRDREAAAVRVLDLVLGPELGQCCGGRVELWLERLSRDDLPWLRAARRAADGSAPERRPPEGRGPERCAPARRGLEVRLVTDVAGDRVSHRLRRSLPGAAALELRRPVAENVSAETSSPRAGTGTHGVATRVPAPFAATLHELVTARRPQLWVFGAGHVGQALVRMLAELALFDLTWIDSRAQLLPAGLPDCVHTRTAAAPADLIGSARPATHYVVMTHDHGLDYELCLAILKRGDAAWLGLIGSASKAARFRARLRREGLEPDRIGALTCPIGVRGIASKLPAAIAISIAAELLQRHAAGAADAAATAATAAPPPRAADPVADARLPPPAAARPAAWAAAPAESSACSGACEACGTARGEAP